MVVIRSRFEIPRREAPYRSSKAERLVSVLDSPDNHLSYLPHELQDRVVPKSGVNAVFMEAAALANDPTVMEVVLQQTSPRELVKWKRAMQTDDEWSYDRNPFDKMIDAFIKAGKIKALIDAGRLVGLPWIETYWRMVIRRLKERRVIRDLDDYKLLKMFGPAREKNITIHQADKLFEEYLTPAYQRS